MTDKIRTFKTGATRSDDDNRLDYEGFLSPLALERYAQYMHEHRKQADGTPRASDNWQKGMPIAEYMKSKWRHFMTTWRLVRAIRPARVQMHIELQESLCAELFNTMGMLHEILNATQPIPRSAHPTDPRHLAKGTKDADL